MNERLLHPGPDKVFPEVRCQYWVLCGRQAIKHLQWTCNGFRRWRGKLVVLKMVDLPPAHLRLLKPPFFSVRVNCFGPYVIKFGRCCEKWWGVIFKYLTTQCVHLNLLNADAFLLALRQFVAQRGTPFKILSDQGTNFRGAGGDRQSACPGRLTSDPAHRSGRYPQCKVIGLRPFKPC